MKKELKILLLEDSITDAEIIKRLLLKENKHYELRVAGDKKSYLKALEDFFPDVILSDNSLPQFNSLDALRIARHRFPHLPFILVTGTVSDEYAANIIKEGADDYILKDRMVRLPRAIDAALSRRKIIKEITDYKYALDQSADITITDKNGIITYANENFCRLSQYSAEELIGNNHRMINSGYHSASFFRYLWATISAGKIWQGEVKNRAKDGSYYWVDTIIVPFLDEKGKPYQYLAIRKDISEEKKAEQNLLQTRIRFEQAQGIAHLGNWEINFATNQAKWSDEACKIYGMAPGDHGFSFEDWLAFIHPDDAEHVKQKIEETEKTLGDLSFYHRIVRRDGTIRHIYSEARYEFDKGEPIGLYGISHDITEIKKLEADLLEQQKQEQLKITATTLEAQEKERSAIGQELHDNINQILVGTKLLLSIIKGNPEKTEELVESSIKNLQKAIEENRKLAHELVTPDLEAESLAWQISNLLQGMFKTAGISININTSILDEFLLKKQQKIAAYRIAQEQCSNIIKYAQATQVNISLSTEGNLFKMIISDNGIGMEESKRTDGIGLKNINARLSVFNGSFSIKTAPGKGFTLIVEMPV